MTCLEGSSLYTTMWESWGPGQLAVVEGRIFRAQDAIQRNMINVYNMVQCSITEHQVSQHHVMQHNMLKQNIAPNTVTYRLHDKMLFKSK